MNAALAFARLFELAAGHVCRSSSKAAGIAAAVAEATKVKSERKCMAMIDRAEDRLEERMARKQCGTELLAAFCTFRIPSTGY